MADFAKVLREQRAAAWEQAKALLDHAADENRDLSAEESEQFDRINEDIDALDARAKDIADTETRRAEFEAVIADLEARGDKRPAKRDDEPDIRSIFTKGGAVEFKVPGNIAEQVRAQTTATATAGYTIPPSTMVHRLYEELILNSAVFGVSTILTTESGEPMDFPRITAANSANAKVGASAQPVTEANALPAVDPVFDKATITPVKYGVLLQVSSELASDTVVDLEGYIARGAAQGISNKAGGALTTTLVAGAGDSGVTASGALSTFTYDNLVDIVYSLAPQYRNRGAQWFVNDALLKVVRKLKDTQNRPLWEPSMQAGAPDTILGYGVVIDPNMPSGGAAAKVALFGDLSTHNIRQVGAIRFESSADYAFNADLITYRCIWRGGSAVLDTQAIKYAKTTS